MAHVREYDYKGTQYTVTVNRDANRYVAVIDIAGVNVRAADREVSGLSEDGAFEAGRRHGKELIDRAVPGPENPADETQRR
jgi:hypothetical protein